MRLHPTLIHRFVRELDSKLLECVHINRRQYGRCVKLASGKLWKLLQSKLGIWI